MRRIGVLTSGGDSPGMNACIRSIVRSGIYCNAEVYGIYRGFEGLIDGDMVLMEPKSVAHIINRGGTILKTARSERFFDPTYRRQAYDKLQQNQIDALICIGGDGTFQGANVFGAEFDVACIGLPGTIDNDLYGTDYTIGYDTALNTVVQAVDKIRDTAQSHQRLFIIEVMGKDAGFIALRSGIGVGAEAVLIPETNTYIDELIEKLKKGRRENKTSGIIIVAEGDDSGGAEEVHRKIKEKFDQYEIRVSVLGHMQRGGSPSAMDRVLASQLGYEAVNAVLAGQRGGMIGMVDKKAVFTPFEKAVKHHDKISQSLINLVEVLSL